MLFLKKRTSIFIYFTPKFDVWCIHRENGILDVSISPKSLLNYKSLLRERNIKFIILEENLQKFVKKNIIPTPNRMQLYGLINCFF